MSNFISKTQSWSEDQKKWMKQFWIQRIIRYVKHFWKSKDFAHSFVCKQVLFKCFKIKVENDGFFSGGKQIIGNETFKHLTPEELSYFPCILKYFEKFLKSSNFPIWFSECDDVFFFKARNFQTKQSISLQFQYTGIYDGPLHSWDFDQDEEQMEEEESETNEQAI